MPFPKQFLEGVPRRFKGFFLAVVRIGGLISVHCVGEDTDKFSEIDKYSFKLWRYDIGADR